MTIGEVSEVILVGAGTRVPKVQEVLLGFLGAERELGKNLNTDEAAAMGAVYKAADLSTGFKVSLIFNFGRIFNFVHFFHFVDFPFFIISIFCRNFNSNFNFADLGILSNFFILSNFQSSF